jgi:hypothetical protein
MSSCRTGIYFFYSLIFYSNGVRELSACGCSVLDKKSKQKNQAKIISGLYPQGLRARGDFIHEIASLSWRAHALCIYV